jgi:signal transduction histidine kinase
MGRPGPTTQAKRNRERSKQERNQEKQEKRLIRKEQKKERDRLSGEGHDPDLDGIVPGPQPGVDHF